MPILTLHTLGEDKKDYVIDLSENACKCGQNYSMVEPTTEPLVGSDDNNPVGDHVKQLSPSSN